MLRIFLEILLGVLLLSFGPLAGVAITLYRTRDTR
jgi:hypothetical protein